MRTSVRLVGCVVLASAVGCHGGKGAASPEAGGCKGQAASFGKWLGGLYGEAAAEEPDLPAKAFELVDIGEETAAKPVGAGTLVVVTTDAITVNGQAVPAAQAKLDARLKAARSAAEEPGVPLLVAIDAQVPWAAVRGITEAATHAGWQEVAFVFKGAWQTPPPPASKLDEEIKAGTEADSPNQASVEDKVYGNCPTAAAVMQDVASMSQADRQRALVERLPGAIERCNCQLDLASARAYHWFKSGHDRPRIVAVVLPLATPSEPGKPITGPATATWSTAAPTVVKAAHLSIGTYHLEISK